MKAKNIPILIGIALPFLFIIIIAAMVYLPSISVKPQYNFLYTSSETRVRFDGEMSIYSYGVREGKLVTKQNPKRYPEQVLLDEKPTLYVYDVKANASREISFDEAQKLSLDAGPTSPDGYTVTYKYGHNGIFELFGSDTNKNGYFITKGNGAKKLTGFGNLGRYWGYEGAFEIIGWIK